MKNEMLLQLVIKINTSARIFGFLFSCYLPFYHPLELGCVHCIIKISLNKRCPFYDILFSKAVLELHTFHHVIERCLFIVLMSLSPVKILQMHKKMNVFFIFGTISIFYTHKEAIIWEKSKKQASQRMDDCESRKFLIFTVV